MDWENLIDPLSELFTPIEPILFVCFIAFMIFIGLNLVTGIVVDTVQGNMKEQRQRMLIARINQLFFTMDTAKQGFITYNEFEMVLNHPHITSLFRSLDIDVIWSRQRMIST